jgi:hypothetical protein
MMRKCHVRFGGGRMEKVHLCAVHRWNLASRLPYVIVWDERSLRRHLQRYLVYYHQWRTHLSLGKDAPVPRAAQPAACVTIVSFPHVGGLHHHYERRAA